MNPGLVRLAFRRTLSPATGLIVLLALGLACAVPGQPESLVPGEDAAVLLRDSRRLDVWSTLLVFVGPVLLFGVARLGTPARLRWIRTTPEPRWQATAALLLGTLLAGALVVLATAVAAEWAAGEGPPALGALARHDSPGALLTEARPEVTWEVKGLDGPAAVRQAVTVAPGSGPAVTALLEATRGGRTVQSSARVSGRTWLRLDLPEGAADDVQFSLQRAPGAGALLVLLPGSLEQLRPVASERLGSMVLGVRVLLLLAAAFALTLGLAAHLRASLAAGLPLVATLAASGWRGAALLPGGDLRSAWEQLATGLVPAWPSAAALLSTVALVGLGLALASRASGPS